MEEVRRRKLRSAEAAKVVSEVLTTAGIESVEEIDHKVGEIHQRLEMARKRTGAARADGEALRGHASDQLRKTARQLASEIEALEIALQDLSELTFNDRRHLNEILALSTKVRRLRSARAVLNDVAFVQCPRCVQELPKREDALCNVCGQDDSLTVDGDHEGEQAKADMDSRVKELEEVLQSQTMQVSRLKRRRNELLKQKHDVDESLDQSMLRYDSAYLSQVLEAEKEIATLVQEQDYLGKLRTLPQRVVELNEEADKLGADEYRIRRELKDARGAAEQDLSNLKRLGELFLDCLLRAKVAGFESDDVVRMSPPWFLPEVLGVTTGEIATTSFGTLGSGGKKNLFKCCYALAIHRLSAELNTFLPTLLIIDSPMKNISERENREQFEGFHALLYELAAGELKGTQFILIDKEYCPPEKAAGVAVLSRHMRTDSDKEPPLIRKYRGK